MRREQELRILFLYSQFSFHNASELVPFQTALAGFKKCQITITSMSSVIKCQALCRWCNHLLCQTMARRSVSTCRSKDNDKLNKSSYYIYMTRQHRKTKCTQSLTQRQTKTIAGHHFQICEELCALLDPGEKGRQMKSHVLWEPGEGTTPRHVSAKVRCLINSQEL